MRFSFRTQTEDTRPGYRSYKNCPYCQKYDNAFCESLRSNSLTRESAYWHVHVQDSPLHVYPLSGGITTDGWGWKGGSPGYRYLYPKNEVQLRKAIARCWRWCDNKNSEEARDRNLAKKVAV